MLHKDLENWYIKHYLFLLRKIENQIGVAPLSTEKLD